MSQSFDLADLKRRMDGAIAAFKGDVLEFSSSVSVSCHACLQFIRLVGLGGSGLPGTLPRAWLWRRSYRPAVDWNPAPELIVMVVVTTGSSPGVGQLVPGDLRPPEKGRQLGPGGGLAQ